MIKVLLKSLRETESEAEIVKLAKGKHKYPNTFKELWKRLT